ncbi:TonB-dependent receptor domain-containing protein [Sphingomonas sp. TX0543]|uniref:TonB-dependent receptor domain-containing protein n=1 Tax=unclassified Sphingomonas TaxID=196159 RepID=UPI0010F93770|nr:TonB-dependent receptor [Sphingomonas sp. 3P27F8]
MTTTFQRMALLTGTAVIGIVTAQIAQAQEASAPVSPASAPLSDTADSGSATGGDVVVTGSRIRSANLESVSPVVQIGAAEFTSRGVSRAEDLVNQLPQVFAAQGSANSNEATGTAQVDLRGLSPSRTLVLVNGRRLPYGSPKSTPSDINQVPAALVRNVEVLTGGASAVYGSDAIAGVVNFNLIDDFQGVKITANVGGYQHGNGDKGLRSLLDANNALVPGAYPKPDKNVWNGFTQDYSVVIGSNMADGRGNVTAYGTYRKINPILQADYDYSACALGATGQNGSQYSCSGSGYNFPSNFANTGGLVNVPTQFRADNKTFVAGRRTYNFAPANYYQRPDERYTLGAMGHYEISEHVVPYFEVSFMDDKSTAQIAPGVIAGGIFGSAGGLNCDNAFLSAQQSQFLCGAAGLSTASNYDANGNYVGAAAIANGLIINRRNVEGGNRRDSIHHSTFRLVGGVRGKIDEAFSYDVFGSYSKVSYNSRFVGNVSTARLGNALNAVIDRRTGSAPNGQIVCAINADASSLNDDSRCAPLDLISGNPASAASVAYIAQDQQITGETALTNIVASVNGDLGKYGVVLPWATHGVGIAFGLEYRKNTLSLNPDEAYQTSPEPEYPVSGSTVAKELFAELNVPLVESRPFFELLSFEGAYRYSDYSTGFKTNTYKLGLNWSPVHALRLRGSYQRAVRAPNVVELFASQSIFEVELTELANGSYDPCSGATPLATAAQCANTGVTAAQYGNIIDNPAGQFNSLIGGNRNLKPEKADTWSLGAVFQPDFIPRFTMSVDYFNITVNDLIGSVNPNLALKNCLYNADPRSCAAIRRGPGGTLFLTSQGYFERFNVNTGSLKTSGIDFSVDYRLPLNSMGTFNFNLVGTYLRSFRTQPLPSSPAADIYECVGLYGGLCGRPRPEWRHKLLTTWSSPFGVDVGLTWRYVSSVKISQTSNQEALNGSFADVNRSLNSRSYFDLSFGYDLLENARLTLGVNNILDKSPPLTTTSAIEDGGNGNTYPQFYDATGRYLFASVSVKF